MTQLRLSKFEFSKKGLAELQETLLAKGEEVSDQSTRLRKQFEQRSSMVAGRLLDVSLERLYDAGATTLSTAANWLDKVAVAREGAEQLRESAKAAAKAKTAITLPPIENYDDLNVKEVNEALGGLSAYELDKVRRYEEAHKNRVTVLREIERLTN